MEDRHYSEPGVRFADDDKAYMVVPHYFSQGELTRFPRPLLTLAAILTALVMIVGLLGNLLTVVALMRCPKVRNVAAAFIISLCIADMAFCAAVLPFEVWRFAAGASTWAQYGALCRAVPFMRYGNVGVSLLSIAMITVNRYIMIAHHGLYSRVYRKVNIALMIIISWLFSLGMQTPTLLGIWGAFGYDEKLGTCSITVDSHGRSSKTALFMIAFVVPCVIIVVCYARIFWVVHRSESRMRQHKKAQAASSSTSSAPEKPSGASLNGALAERGRARVKDQREQKAKRNEWRITKMVLAIFLSFLVCYLPITIAKIADSDVTSPAFHMIGYLLLYASACINPIIYVIMNRQYRNAYADALHCRASIMAALSPRPSTNEKSKEQHGYSYSHSRTMVSQVSLADRERPLDYPDPSTSAASDMHRTGKAGDAGPPSDRDRERLLDCSDQSTSEKSKEQHGYSYSHSRTMVSQVSLADRERPLDYPDPSTSAASDMHRY